METPCSLKISCLNCMIAGKCVLTCHRFVRIRRINLNSIQPEPTSGRSMITRANIYKYLALVTLLSGGSVLTAAEAVHLDHLVKVEHAGNAALSLEYDLSVLTPTVFVREGERYANYLVPGEGMTFDQGMPLLPAISRFVVVPPEAGLEFIVDPGESRTLIPDLPLALCEDSVQAVDARLQRQRLYPATYAEMSEPVVLRGVRMVKVTTYPLQWDQQARQLIYRPRISTEVRFTNDAPVNPVEHRITHYRSPWFRQAISDFVANPEDAFRDDSPEPRPYVGHYLVAIREECLAFARVREWIEFRRKCGYLMEILPISSQNSSFSSTRNLIQQRYTAWAQRGIDPFEMVLIYGDWDTYDRGNQDRQYIISPDVGETIWGGPNHSDYRYACLDGNDILLDVGLARMPAGTESVTNLVLGRTLAYEANPRMQNPEWFRRGVVYSQHWGNSETSAWHVTIHTNVRWGEEVLKRLGFNYVRFYENYQWDQAGNSIGPVLAEEYNRGCNVFIGRAENYYWGSNFQGIQNNTVFPIDIVYSGHGEWTLQVMFRTLPGGNNLYGPAARTCGWGWPSTAPMSFLWAKHVNNVLQHDLPFGIGYSMALNYVDRVFPNFRVGEQVGRGQNLYNHIRTDTDCWGDPGIQPWIGVPRVVTMEVPQEVAPGTKLIECRVFSENEPFAGAEVTLYAPGPMPALNQPVPYGNYNRHWWKTLKSDEEGYVRFVLTDRDTLHTQTQLFMTAAGRNIKPFFGAANIVVPPAAVIVRSSTISEVDGNGDDVPSPGDWCEIAIEARNSGNRNALEGVSATLTSLSPWITLEEDADIWFGDIGAGQNADGNRTVRFAIAPDCPDAGSRPSLRPAIEVAFTSGESRFRAAIPIDVAGPNWEIASVVGGAIIPDTVYALQFNIRNKGSAVAPPARVRIRSLGMGISVIGEETSIAEIAPGEAGQLEAPFTVSGNRLVVPGSKTGIRLIFTTESGNVDSADYTLQVARPRANAPMGPDKYGYICFDDTDTAWAMSPQYDWIEIADPQNRVFNGTQLNFTGQSPENVGEARVIPLGFRTQFYGTIYDSITVVTNGIICPGSQPRIANFQSWPMDYAIAAGAGTIAPFWTPLRLGNNFAGSGIWVHHDTTNARFIVQFQRMRLANGQTEVTFQVILYDRATWITESGDQNILFQYRQISNPENIRQNDQIWENGIPYASVGISSPDGRTGLRYTFKGEYDVTSATLANRRAILYSTSPRFRSGILYGWVRDAATGNGIPEAIINTEHGFVAYTDEEGYWRIGEALAEVPFDIAARKLGYNDSSYTDLSVPEGDSIEINFELLHPEFHPSVDDLWWRLDPNQEHQIPFSLFNGGNGPLTWTAEKRLLGDANAAPWEFRRSYDVGARTRDDRIEGVVFAQEKFYCAGAS
ncbi:MAG: hypothetical protein FJY67_07410, partial [Calditrichaeota bacterium]|nr:hypothetical protein [Calditrichota bacterium]